MCLMVYCLFVGLYVVVWWYGGLHVFVVPCCGCLMLVAIVGVVVVGVHCSMSVVWCGWFVNRCLLMFGDIRCCRAICSS